MEKTSLQKCVLMICVFFAMCPCKSRPESESNDNKATGLKGDSEDEGHKLAEIDTLDKNILSGWNNLGTSEPGFQFTQDEMVKFKIWPNAIIPYYIDVLSFDYALRQNLRQFLESTNAETSVQFSELTRPPDDDSTRYVFFVNRRGLLDCIDYNPKDFTNEGVQRVVLGYDCFTSGSDLASIVLAILGIPPQHNAPDRDKHITVQEENILPDKLHLFEVLGNSEWLFHDVGYDYGSAGHYDFFKYTRNGQATFKVPKRKQKEKDFRIGDSTGFTYTDAWKICMLYNFISRKGKNATMTDCKKLFEHGIKYNDIEAFSEDEVKPRSKPKLYISA